MRSQLTAAGLMVTIMASGTALAVGPGKTLEFKGSPMGKVIFDGTTHQKAGLTCADCHNPEVFPKMKQGTIKITMNDLKAGKYCGRCHNGKKAFKIDECTSCHHKPEAK
jgi:c(7)-type cytochrome triheme protein